MFVGGSVPGSSQLCPAESRTGAGGAQCPPRPAPTPGLLRAQPDRCQPRPEVSAAWQRHLGLGGVCAPALAPAPPSPPAVLLPPALQRGGGGGRPAPLQLPGGVGVGGWGHSSGKASGAGPGAGGAGIPPTCLIWSLAAGERQLGGPGRLGSATCGDTQASVMSLRAEPCSPCTGWKPVEARLSVTRSAHRRSPRDGSFSSTSCVFTQLDRRWGPADPGRPR